MKPRILLTGATGFIGTHILKYLLVHRYTVIPIVRQRSIHKLPRSPYLKRPLITENLFLENAEWWKKNSREADILIHLAWYAKPEKYLYSKINYDCLVGTLIMARALAEKGIKHFVGVGTCLEYKKSNKPVSVNSPLSAACPYSACKLATFIALEHCLQLHGTTFAWCRVFHLFGEGEHRQRLIPTLHRRLRKGLTVKLTSGEQVRDFMNVQNAAKIISKIALKKKEGVFNICSGKPLKIKRLAKSIAKKYNRLNLLRFGKRKKLLFDPKFIVGIKKI